MVHVLQATQNLVISRCCVADDGEVLGFKMHAHSHYIKPLLEKATQCFEIIPTPARGLKGTCDGTRQLGKRLRIARLTEQNLSCCL